MHTRAHDAQGEFYSVRLVFLSAVLLENPVFQGQLINIIATAHPKRLFTAHYSAQHNFNVIAQNSVTGLGFFLTLSAKEVGVA